MVTVPCNGPVSDTSLDLPWMPNCQIACELVPGPYLIPVTSCSFEETAVI